MTNEEAIFHLQEARKYPVAYDAQEQEAFEVAFSALHAQQSTIKLDRSRWGKCEMCGDGEINTSPGAHDFIIADDCLFYNDSEFGLEGVLIKYCPFCSRPLTEEAWAELERRIGGNNGTTD